MNFHFKLQAFNHQFPDIAANDELLRIVRALLWTGGKFEDVQFITNASEQKIMEMYHCLKEHHYFDIATKPIKSSLKEIKETTKRKIERKEMATFVQMRLCEENEDIEMLHLKYNVLTFRINGDVKTVYLCTSKDYEFRKECALINTNRISAWHKSSFVTFTKYDYYAFLVKLDARSTFVPKYEGDIEGILLSKAELYQWMKEKQVIGKNFINCYVHYIQKANANELIRLQDGRNASISLMDYYEKGFDVTNR